MAPRQPSPTPSENEVDIVGSLFADDAETGSSKRGRGPAVNGDDLDFEGLLNTGGGDGADEDGGDEAFIALRQAASFRKTTNLKGKTAKKGGGFQSMGLGPNLLKAIARKGYSVPTPIQRKTIPLIMARKDVVGMARTGSGKTAAFVIPMIERLRAHSARVGARALIMSPSRELAIQTLKVVKEFGRGTDLKSVLLVGGDSLEEQFAAMASNPDIIIATPGRFLHLKVEMSLGLYSIKYVVFDEADRLFEMGFAAQLTEILHALPASRQTLLFSATLPSSLVEFARAGLQDPSLIRLDAETKVSPDLESGFFAVKGGEKEGALLHILHDVIKMPLGLPEGAETESEMSSKKRKRGGDVSYQRPKPTEHSTIVFAATKHHVEYLATLLQHAGFAVSYVYGSLDQTARRIQVENFRRGQSNILVVTDVAARGIDIPVLANVINYDFPPQPKIFVHRVGRTARAGKAGWSYSFVREADAPYLLDLQLFLGRKLVIGRDSGDPSFAADVVVGSLKRSEVETNVEWVNKILDENSDINALRGVSVKAEKLYMKTRNSASTQSARRARELVGSRAWSQLHPIFDEEAADIEEARSTMLAQISGFKPQETIFEIGPRGKSAHNRPAEIMRNIRTWVGPRRRKGEDGAVAEEQDGSKKLPPQDDDDDDDDAMGGGNPESDEDVVAGQAAEAEDESDEEELEVTVSNTATSRKGEASWKDPEVFMSYTPRTLNAADERGYGVHSGGQNANSFVEEARHATMDLTNDDGAKAFGEPARARMRWDKKQSKYVANANDEDGSRGARMVRGESGVKIAASFQSGRFDKWRRAHRLGKLPQVGEAERVGLARSLQAATGGGQQQGPGGFRFRHTADTAPKEADKFRDDYHVRKKRVAEAKEKRVGKYRDGAGKAGEVKDAEAIRRERRVKELKMAKNARPAKRGGGKGGKPRR